MKEAERTVPLLLFVFRKKNMRKPEKAEEAYPLLFSVYGSRKPAGCAFCFIHQKERDLS